jgi:peptide/nickel transport system substrate-binding protein
VRAIAVIGAGLVGLTVGAGCADTASEQGRPGRGGTLHMAQADDAITFDQAKLADNVSIRIYSQIAEPLYRADARGRLVPWLARGAKQSPDGLTWTIRLREGVRFSDGTPMTAADVVFSLNRSRKSDFWGFMLTTVKSVRKTSPSVVEITTKHPFVALPATLSLFANSVIPEDFGGKSEKEFGEHPIGTGPFVLDSWKKGQLLTLKRNRYHWRKGRPLLDEVQISPVTDDSSRVAQLRGGEQDLIAAPPWAQLDSIDKAPGLRAAQYSPAGTYQLLLNSAKPVFRDRRIREAIALAIDRDSIRKIALQGRGEVGRSFLAPTLKYFDKDLPELAYDPDRARQLVSAATGGAQPAFTFLLKSSGDLDRTIAQLIQENLKAAGMKVTLQPVDSSALGDLQAAGDYDVVLDHITSDIVDPTELANYFVGTDDFHTSTDLKRVAAMTAEADAERDPAARAQLYADIQKAVRDEYAVIPLVYDPFTYAFSDKVTGFTVNPTGIYSLADVGLRH